MATQVDTLRLLAQPELTENPTARKSDTKEIKNKHSSRPVGGGGDGQDRDWRSVGQTGQAVPALADPAIPHSHIDKPRGLDSEWWRMGQAEQQVAPSSPTFAHRKTRQTAGNKADHATQGSSTGK